jgi:polyhydroxyalkanoate synthase
LASGRGLPRQVDARPFKLGKNVANTPGAVVYRNALVELIQYAPTTSVVHARPLLIVPPQINKYYVFDLAPDKSLVRYALDSGVQTFVASWRNPGREHADCGLDAYAEALEQAVDAMRTITGSPDVNVLGACSGGITLTALLGLLASRSERKVRSATLAVCVLDTSAVRNSTAGMFVTPATVAAAKAASRRRGVVEGTELARMFAWMRPNDLVWNYVVNNYLLGETPPAFDLLYWNADSANLPGPMYAFYLRELYLENRLRGRGALTMLGERVDLSRIDMPVYVLASRDDHIVPWRSAFATAALVAGEASFTLAASGHIAGVVNPPAAGKRNHWIGPLTGDPDQWLARAQSVPGSWWPHWIAWLAPLAGPRRPAPAAQGDARHPPLDPAPGRYVTEPVP